MDAETVIVNAMVRVTTNPGNFKSIPAVNAWYFGKTGDSPKQEQILGLIAALVDDNVELHDTGLENA